MKTLVHPENINQAGRAERVERGAQDALRGVDSHKETLVNR